MSSTEPDRSVLPIPPTAAGDPTSVDIREQDPPFALSRPVSPPQGAPNVVVVLIDDMGFGASSAFGGPCEMPVAERLAAGGLRYTRFHTTAICSATRAALLTGRNHHSVGFGHVVEQAGAAPGYNAQLPASAATIARTLNLNGYATGAFGKMHETPRHETSTVGPFDRWPTGREGFERFYGFLGGEINQYYPALFDGTTPVEPPRSPADGYHLSEDIVDRAIGWVNDLHTISPQRPFLCYLPFGATHAPFHVPPGWAEKYAGRFDHGWDAQRQLTLARQKQLGVVPADAELAPWVESVPAWDSLDDESRRAGAALMELYAGFAEHTDAQVGRLIDALAANGQLDNTLVYYILGDNGASPEGGLTGALNEYATFNGLPETAAEIVAQRDSLGEPGSWPIYPVGWALAMDTPYQWMKHMASHYGGTRTGLVVHWPAGISAAGALRHQWHHVIDVAPTILEAAGLPAPESVDGAEQQPIEGTSMLYSFDHGDAPERHTKQYFEIGGSRGIYHQGWVACTTHENVPWDYLESNSPALHEDRWELYDTTVDWTQADDIAAQHPERLRQLQELFMIEAARHQVLPLDDRPLTLRRSESERPRITAMTFHGGARRVPADAMPDVVGCSHVISARIVVPADGASGVICAQGGRFSGWSLYCHEGCLRYCHTVGQGDPGLVRSGKRLEPGAHEVRFEFQHGGERLGGGGNGSLWLDGERVGEGRIEKTVAFLFVLGEDFNVGIDPLSPVSDEYPQGDNRFAGEVEWVRIEIGEGGVRPSAAAREEVDMAIQ